MELEGEVESSGQPDHLALQQLDLTITYAARLLDCIPPR